jgi:hypothetical protein
VQVLSSPPFFNWQFAPQTFKWLLMTPAVKIRVDCFRQIMIWPLQLINHDASLESVQIDEVTNLLEKSGWKWGDRAGSTNATQLKDLPGYGADNEFDYSEIVYFHSYVRDFLYGGDRKKPDKRSMRVLRRKDIEWLCIDLDEHRKYQLKVERLEAYLFQTGVLLIVAEVENPKPQKVEDPMPQEVKAPKPQEEKLDFFLSLKDAMDLQNVMRMVFPRRWNNKGVPSETPLRAAWLDSEGKLLKVSEQNYAEKNDFINIVRENAELPAAKHWRYLLKDFPLYGEDQTNNYAIKQIEDQRIPSMTYLAVPDPREISEWDFARIAFYDSAGESSVGSYSDEFLKDWDKKSAYDRFWQRTPRTGFEKGVLDHNSDMRTRWLCSGYGLAVVGASDDPRYRGQIAANFRHHYFRMGLIAHFQRASLLTFRDQLAEATEKSGSRFRDEVMKIQSNVTKFRARFWFHEVSTQLQGQEIFAWWTDRLGNRAMFDQVTSDIAAAESQLRTEMEAAEAKWINTIAEIGGSLAVVGLLVAVAALFVSICTATWQPSFLASLVIFVGVFGLPPLLAWILWRFLHSHKPD